MPKNLAVKSFGHLAKNASVLPDGNGSGQIFVLIENQDEILRSESDFLVDRFLEKCVWVFPEETIGIFRCGGMAYTFALAFGMLLEEENCSICSLFGDLVLKVTEGLVHRDRDHEVIQSKAEEESSASKDRGLRAEG